MSDQKIIKRLAERHAERTADNGEQLTVVTEHRKGWAVITESKGSSITDVVRELNQFLVRKLTGATTNVPKMKGAVKAYSFHWSNAQEAWDVIPVRLGDFPLTMQDGADFTLFVLPSALSPLGKVWNLTEMKYVAKALSPHPGFWGSPESAGRTSY